MVERPNRRAWAGLWVLAIALGMIVLDGTVVGVALPSIIRDLHMDLTAAQWVNSLYSVVFAAPLLTVGRLGDRFGRRRFLLVGVSVFVIGSVLAALSTAEPGLLVARAVQGIGAALVLPSTLSTVNATFQGRDRAAAFGIWGAVMSGAAAIGPLLGGWITQVSSWQVIFWINVPLGVAVIVAAVLLVDETRSADRSPGVDVVGPVLSGLGLGLLVFGLIESSALGWWAPKADLNLGVFTWPSTAPVSAVPVAIAVGLVCLGGFVAWEADRARTGRAAVLDLRLFAHRSFSLGNVVAMLVAVGEFALVFVLPLFLVVALGLDTLGAGLVLAAMALGAFASGAAARHLAARIGPVRVVRVGLTLEIAGAAATAVAVGTLSPSWLVAACLLPYGLGLGLASAQLTSVTLGDVPVDQSGSGSATQSTVRQLGSALGSAIGGTALAGFLGTHDTSAQIEPARYAMAAAASVGVAAVVLTLALLMARGLPVSAGHAAPARTPEHSR